MKKFISNVLVVVLIFSFISIPTGCKKAQSVNENKSNFKSLFDIESSFTEKEREIFESGDDIIDLLYASPFYEAPIFTVGLQDKTFFEERKKLIDDIIIYGNQIEKSSLELFEYIDDLQKELEIHMDLYVSKSILKEYLEKEFKDLEKQALDIAMIANAIDDLRGNNNSSYSKSWDDALRVCNQVDFGMLTIEYLGHISTVSAFLINYAEEENLKELQEKSNTLDSILENSKAYDKTIIDILQKLSDVKVAYQSLDKADFYYALSSLHSIRDMSKLLNIKIENAKVTEELKQKDIDFMKEIVNFYELLSNDMENALMENNLYETQLSKNKEKSFFAGLITTTVYAEDNNKSLEYYNAAKSSASVRNSEKVESKKTWYSSLWDGVKKHTNGFRKMVGHVTSMGTTVLKDATDAALMYYEGCDMKDIKKQLEENHEYTRTKFKEGTAGSDFYEGVKKSLENIDEFVGNTTEKIIGKGNISRFMGQSAKFVSGIFTGLGKDIATAANPKSKGSEVASSIVNITLTISGFNLVKATGKGVCSAFSKIANTKYAKSFISKSVEYTKPLIQKSSKLANWFSNSKLGSKIVKYGSELSGKLKNGIVKAKDKLTSLFKKTNSIEKTLKNSKSKIIQNTGKAIEKINHQLTNNKLLKDAFGGSQYGLIENYYSGEVMNYLYKEVGEALDSKEDEQGDNRIEEENDKMTDQANEKVDQIIDSSDEETDKNLDKEDVEGNDVLDNTDKETEQTSDEVDEEVGQTRDTDKEGEEDTEVDTDEEAGQEKEELENDEILKDEIINNIEVETEDGVYLDGLWSNTGYVGYASKISVSNEFSQELGEGKSYVELNIDGTGKIIAILRIFNTGMMDMDEKLVSKSKITVEGNKMRVSIKDDEGDTNKIEGVLDGEKLNGKITSIIDEDTIVIDFVAKKK